VESTYGNRVHEKDDDGSKLAQAIKATVDRGGKVIIPAFAVGRVEELLFWINRLEDERRIPVLPVFVDSPMATEALRRYSER
jgi:metallo-beta-lactamase family protein